MNYEPAGAAARRKAGNNAKLKQGADVGSTDRVRNALKAGPLGITELKRAAHVSERSAKHVLFHLVATTGGVVRLADGRYARYDSAEARSERTGAEPSKGEFAMAKPREYEWKPLVRDPMAHMKLCSERR